MDINNGQGAKSWLTKRSLAYPLDAFMDWNILP